MAFARALGEFGATIMLAGNIAGRTQTMSTAIYSAVQAGDRTSAFQWSIIIMVISFAVMIAMNYWGNHPNKAKKKNNAKAKEKVV